VPQDDLINLNLLKGKKLPFLAQPEIMEMKISVELSASL
jgi:hypothetical protein